jgi:hypothetical protein
VIDLESWLMKSWEMRLMAHIEGQMHVILIHVVFVHVVLIVFGEIVDASEGVVICK